MESLKIIAPFELENGQTLSEIEIAYCVYGKLNKKKSNVIWICHALTANADAADWWEGLVGPDQLFNPDEYFIVCANMLGSCYGTTGPASINPATERPYQEDFPKITIRDMVRTHQLLQEHLGISKIKLCIGGSMGGQQVLEWAISHPNNFEQICVLATNAQHSPWGIAFNETQRMAIETGFKAGLNQEDAINLGFETARAIAMLSYRHYDTYGQSQAEDDNTKLEQYKASSYQRYQGEKLRKRFDVYSYIRLSQAMDSHHVGRKRDGVEKALQQISAKTLVIGIQSDILFPIKEQIFLADHIPNAQLEIINSFYGHDGFLVEYTLIAERLRNFLEEKENPQSGYYRLNNRRQDFLSEGRLALPGMESF